MRYADLINEYQLVGTKPWEEVPPSTGSHPAGHIFNSEWVIKVFHDTEGASFWIEHKGNDVAFAEIKTVSDYVALHHAFVLPEYQGKGIMSELCHWIIRDKGQALINDTQMSTEGVKLWNGLMRSMGARIIDISNGKSFDLDDPKAPRPESDSAQPDFYDASSGKGQRYFYIIEAPEYFKHIVEGVEHHYSCNIKRHAYSERPKMLPRYYCDGDA